ncbi:MAG: type IV toxin-antitoxin system AbiEi family antitoxin domain-containing protein [Myxococcota bacterium]|jgi:very-short-patch-repair endonuclease
MDRWAAVAATGRRQLGLITTEQLLEAGLTRSAIKWAVRDRRLERVGRRLYRLAGAPTSWRQRAKEALLRCGEHARLSHGSAAHLWRLDGFEYPPWPIEVTVPHGSYVSQQVGVRVHQSRLDDSRHVVLGLEVGSVGRTLIDLAVTLDDEALEIALDSAQRRFRHLGPWLLALAETDAARGMAPLAHLAGLVLERQGQHAESALEVRVWRGLRRARHLPPPRLQHEVFDGAGYVMRVDFAWPQERVALHADGYRWHARRDAWDTDATQRNRLSAAGWKSLIVTSATLDSDWLDTLASLLRARSPQLSLFQSP